MLDKLPSQAYQAIIGKAKRHVFQNGETIFQREDEGDFMVSPVTGRIKIVLYSEDGREILLNLIQPKQICGEFSFLDGRKRSADAIADGICEVLFFHRSMLQPVLDSYPVIMQHLLDQTTQLLRENTRFIETITFLNLEQKLARLLLRLIQQYGQHQPNGIYIASELNQAEFGQFIATSRESINKQLRKWEDEKWIKSDKKGLLISDITQLLRLAKISDIE